MRIQAATGVLSAMVTLTCIAGDLEDGIKFHERKDYASALSAFQRAATTGNAEARRRLGFMYYHGEGLAQDNNRAVLLFEEAAEAGDIPSAFNLGKMYEYGITVKQNDNRAAAWYRKAAEMGDPSSQFESSVMYYQGRGVPQDRVEAAMWWTLAMSAGGELAERWRPSVESAAGKLTPEEIAEGKRRAAEWRKAGNTTK